mmetsp:Transcript_5103/g.14225  ORF Transcript_5103/g.14225 Transcript_5103/m.14225 type:complete len:500 (-) Transcript_5103:414-1913(-)|eukprot:CAMPEP_0194527112 /NCGR_PEP_ID=MMETSP0253-20130528/63103_1 /TAXON_ID=2966 /ORGANISM="Noctiluca scintillans" /LENGTH=499 /DNA_ID=CAMNT_0039372001 /DNA_START=38 /DNA_END=1537 /DNA_ORIENTATION=+
MAGTGQGGSSLSGRIQGYGNFNPPPLPDSDGVTAKEVVSRVGDMLGEEVMLTVEDFKEKGAIGAVTDAVLDAGDLLIDGATGIFGWLRGDAPTEDDGPVGADAARALSNGPSGAAYGISQASPTGGVNAVWVMPEEADLAALAKIGPKPTIQSADPRIPKNIQPYEPDTKKATTMPAPIVPLNRLPGGAPITPYQLAPTGGRVSPFVPGGVALPQGTWGPAGYSSWSGAAPSGGGAKSYVERIAKGELIVGPDVAKRLIQQCSAAKTSPKQLGEIISERARRLYLGLDGGEASDADQGLIHLLLLVNELHVQGTAFSNEAVEVVKSGVSEELLSLRSSAKHREQAEPLLGAIGLVTIAADLLGTEAPAAPSREATNADLLGESTSAAPSMDLLSVEEQCSPEHVDLVSGMCDSTPAMSSVADLDPLAPGSVSATTDGSSGLLDGLSIHDPVRQHEDAVFVSAGTAVPDAVIDVSNFDELGVASEKVEGDTFDGLWDVSS